MPLTTIGAVWDRISLLVSAQGYKRSQTPFDFDVQPDGKLDVTYHMRSERRGTVGYVGGDQAEQHLVEIYLARRVKRDAWGAARQLKSDMDLIELAILDDYPTQDYILVDDSVSTSVQDVAEGDFVIGQFSCTVDFDRTM